MDVDAAGLSIILWWPLIDILGFAVRCSATPGCAHPRANLGTHRHRLTPAEPLCQSVHLSDWASHTGPVISEAADGLRRRVPVMHSGVSYR
jgi:hypothetical protein